MPTVIKVRAACISATCCSMARTPRVLTPMTAPIATIETATSASATSTSMMVNPASMRLVGGDVASNDFYPSGEPVDADLISRIEPRQRDGAAAGTAIGEEADGRQCGAALTA